MLSIVKGLGRERGQRRKEGEGDERHVVVDVGQAPGELLDEGIKCFGVGDMGDLGFVRVEIVPNDLAPSERSSKGGEGAIDECEGAQGSMG